MNWFDISKVLLLAFACTVVTGKKPSSDRRSVMSENASVVSIGGLEVLRPKEATMTTTTCNIDNGQWSVPTVVYPS